MNELERLKEENKNLRNLLKDFIPRRRVRRVYKQLKKILTQDIEQDNICYVNYLKSVVRKYRDKNMISADPSSYYSNVVDEPLIVAIEHLLGTYDENI